MKSIGELVLLAAKKAGIAEGDDSLKAIIENKILFTTAIDDAVFSKVDSDLISFDDAKSHPLIAGDIKSKAKREALDGIDRDVIPRVLKDLGIQDSDVAEILGEKNTFQKVELLTKKISELSLAKGKANNSGDKAEFAAQIQALNAEVLKVKAEADQQKTTLESAYNSKVYDFALTSKLSGKNFIVKDGDNSVLLQMSKGFIANELQAKGAKAIYDEATNAIRLVKADNPELPYYENNKEVDFTTFADRVLLEKKLVSPNGPPSPAPPNNGGNPPLPPPSAGMSSIQLKNQERAAAFKGGE